MKGKTIKLPPPELRAAGVKRVIHVGPAGRHQLSGGVLYTFFGQALLQSLPVEPVAGGEPDFPFLKEAGK